MSIGLIALLDDIAAIAKVADSALHYLPTVTIVRSRNRYCTKTAPRWGACTVGTRKAPHRRQRLHAGL